MTTTAEKTIIAWIHGYMQNKHRFSLTQYLTCNCSCVLEASITWFHYFNTKCLVKVQCIPIFIFEPNVTKTEANNEKYHYDFPDIYIQSSSHSALSSSFATVPSIVLYACRSTWKHLCHLVQQKQLINLLILFVLIKSGNIHKQFCFCILLPL